MGNSSNLQGGYILIPKQLKPYKFCKISYQDKRPFEDNWLNKGYSFDSMNDYLKKNKSNYGILTGNLRILDDDTSDKRLLNLFIQHFGETFRIHQHFYFEFDTKNDKKIIFYDKDGTHCGELQGKGQQIVCAGSRHPKGHYYEQKNNEEIKIINEEEFRLVFEDYIPKKKIIEREHIQNDWSGDKVSEIPISSIISFGSMSDVGGCYQGSHPVHGSTGGMNFRVNPTNNCWYCFRCGSGGGPAELIAVVEGIIDCSDARSQCFSSEQGRKVIEVAREKYGLKAPETNFSNYKPQGWALSINIRKMAERKKFTQCPKCKVDFTFNEEIGFFKCKCYRGGIKMFMKHYIDSKGL